MLPTEGGEHIFVKISKQNASELKFHQKAVLQITFFDAYRVRSDFGRVHVQESYVLPSATHVPAIRESPGITANRIRATPFSINLSIHLISSSLSIYLSIDIPPVALIKRPVAFFNFAFAVAGAIGLACPCSLQCGAFPFQCK